MPPPLLQPVGWRPKPPISKKRWRWANSRIMDSKSSGSTCDGSDVRQHDDARLGNGIACAQWKRLNRHATSAASTLTNLFTRLTQNEKPCHVGITCPGAASHWCQADSGSPGTPVRSEPGLATSIWRGGDHREAGVQVGRGRRASRDDPLSVRCVAGAMAPSGFRSSARPCEPVVWRRGRGRLATQVDLYIRISFDQERTRLRRGGCNKARSSNGVPMWMADVARYCPKAGPTKRRSKTDRSGQGRGRNFRMNSRARHSTGHEAFDP